MRLSVEVFALTLSWTSHSFVYGTASAPPPANLLKEKLGEKSVPDTGAQWTTLANGVEYQPAANLSPLAEMHLRQLTATYPTGNFEKMFVDGAETYYDEYAQAWRALGFFIDCGYQQTDARRDLQEGEEGCRRYMLWAAYVDEEYSGNGVGEYMYYDRKNDYWDPRACDYEHTDRCVKMDCHLPDTHFSLLGYFKEPEWDEWFGQLFKHEGDCVWTDEEYQFMQSNREILPDGCTSTGVYAEDGSTLLYYDIKPSWYGEIEIGVYVDSNCIKEYQGKTSALGVMRQMICGNNGGDGDAICAAGEENYYDAYQQVYGSSNNNNNNNGGGDHQQGARNMWAFASNMETWNRAFDVYKQCQPCVTYDLTNYVAGNNYEANADGLRYQWTSAAMADGDGADDGEDVFQCHDVAGYDNVNQCMKFKTKTEMMTAHWNDVEMAVAQRSIASISFPGFKQEFRFTAEKSETTLQRQGTGNRLSFLSAWLMLLVSMALFGVSWFRFRSLKLQIVTLKEPLVPSKQGVSA